MAKTLKLVAMPEDLEETTEERHPLGITVAEASARLGLSETIVSKLIQVGRLRAEKLGNKWYIDPELKISPLSVPAQPPLRGPQASPPSPGPVPKGGGDPFFALRSLPDDHIIEIYRLRQGKRFYVCSMTPEEFSLRAVSRDFGGGVYLAVGSSDGQAVAQHGFAVDGPEKHPDNLLSKDDPQPQIIIPSTDSQSLQIQQLAGQVQALQQALMAMAANASRPQEDGEGRKHWLEEMLLMKQALAPPPLPPPPPQISPEESRKRWLEEVMLLKQIFAQPQQQPPDNLGAISSALMKGVEMAAAVSSIGEKEGVGTALIKGMIPTLSEVVGGIAKNLIAPPAASSPSPNPPEIRQVPIAQGSGGNGNTDNLGDRPSQPGSGIDLLLPVLRRAARENRDPYPYAAMIASEIPDEAIGAMRAATAEQFQEFAASLDPQLSEYPGWVSELRGALMTELAEEESDGKP